MNRNTTVASERRHLLHYQQVPHWVLDEEHMARNVHTYILALVLCRATELSETAIPHLLTAMPVLWLSGHL